MASSIYTVKHMNWDQNKHNRTKRNKDVRLSNESINKYEHHAVAFLDWCKTTYGTNKPKFCRKHIQDYADYLHAQGKSASTIHDYINGVCRVFGAPLADISKPRRVAAENRNNRRASGSKAVDRRRDAQEAASPKLVAIAGVAGIRRSEYRALRRNDYALDESGWPCIVVRRGKNGKRQLQRIPAECVELVRSFFDGSDDYLFTQEELRNKINLHRLRGELARKMYQIYARRIENEPGYEIALREQLFRRFCEEGVKERWSPHEVSGLYRLRGANRRLAESLGLPTDYYRLAVMAVSVFHLSHWRNDVTVANYLLAV